MQHAEVKIGDYKIPLIGIPKGAVLEFCDLCHDEFYIGDIEYNGKQFLCRKCKKEK
jgi:hypothetical protein